jgi:rhodanese-related sulfurtransferase
MTQIEAGTDAFFDQFARITGALGASSRLKLLDRLCQGEQSVEELAAASELTVSNASRHLRQLAECRLAAVRRDPPRVYYRVADDAVVRFWFALRDLARSQLLELDLAVSQLIGERDKLSPLRREELLDRMRTGEVVLLDVRPTTEYRAGHIPGATSVPLEQLEERLASLPTASEIVAYCRGPYCLLAVDAVSQLRARGFKAVRLEDGLPEWKAAGLPVTTGLVR